MLSGALRYARITLRKLDSLEGGGMSNEYAEVLFTPGLMSVQSTRVWR